MRKPLRKAIFPVGGLGTRFLPATKAMPKEMLPVVDKPLIQYAVEEARAAGIEEMIFVTGRGKSAIEDHFDYSYELQETLKERSTTCASTGSGTSSRRASNRVVGSSSSTTARTRSGIPARRTRTSCGTRRISTCAA